MGYLFVYKDGDVRKIEIKTMQNADKWIAINGNKAISKLFFERDYWIYFVLYPENVVIVTKALPFMQVQFGFDNDSEYLKNLQLWLNLSKQLIKNNKFKFINKINVSLTTPIREIYNNFEYYKESFNKAIYEIWKNNDGWQLIYQK